MTIETTAPDAERVAAAFAYLREMRGAWREGIVREVGVETTERSVDRADPEATELRVQSLILAEIALGIRELLECNPDHQAREAAARRDARLTGQAWSSVWITPLRDGAHDYTPLLRAECPNHPGAEVYPIRVDGTLLQCKRGGERYELNRDQTAVRVHYPAIADRVDVVEATE